MGSLQDKQADSCGGCVRCEVPAQPAADGPMRGGRMALAAMGVFLLPPAAALGGALLVGGGEAGQFAGALGGLLCGAALAAGGARLLRRAPKEAS